MTTAVFIITALGIWEMNRLWDKMGVRTWQLGCISVGALYVFSAQWVNGLSLGVIKFAPDFNLSFILFLSIVMSITYMVAKYPAFTFIDISVTVLTPLYTGWLLAHLVSLRELPQGFHFVLLVLVATWSTDTFAYFVGITIGKHRLAPVLSPKKSVEGSIGGVIGSVVASVIIGYLDSHMPITNYIIIGLLVGIVGQVGDLAESALKRMAGVKDAGTFIPGHGGILDRFDSMFLTAPIVYYYLRIINLS